MTPADASARPVTVAVADEAGTAGLAAALAAVARIGDVFGLSGALGTGKTAFARAFINAGSQGPEEVPSPTFTLVQAYAFTDEAGGEIPVHHFDLYRIEDAAEVRELGLEDALAQGIVLIEWPERLGVPVPGNVLDVLVEQGTDADARRVTLVPHGSWEARLGPALGGIAGVRHG